MLLEVKPKRSLRPPRASRWSAPNSRFIYRKETWRRIASHPPPGSFFDEKMLSFPSFRWWTSSDFSTGRRGYSRCSSAGAWALLPSLNGSLLQLEEQRVLTDITLFTVCLAVVLTAADTVRDPLTNDDDSPGRRPTRLRTSGCRGSERNRSKYIHATSCIRAARVRYARSIHRSVEFGSTRAAWSAGISGTALEKHSSDCARSPMPAHAGPGHYSAAYHRLVVANNLAVASSNRVEHRTPRASCTLRRSLALATRFGRGELTARVYTNSAAIVRAAGRRTEADEREGTSLDTSPSSPEVTAVNALRSG